MSAMDNVFDQENRPLGGGPLGRRSNKLLAHEADPAAARPQQRAVLGEISQNVRRQSTRNISNKSQGTFSIYCDDGAPTKVTAKSQQAAKVDFSGILEDKENAAAAIPKALKVSKLGLRGSGPVEGVEPALRLQPANFVNLPKQIEPMNTSVVDVDSPMVVENCVAEFKEQWRVPPIKDNVTVDIFTEPEYFQDIYRYLKQSEVKHLPKWNYMAKQNDITHSMRSILVDWLVEVGEEYKLQSETLHLTVNYIDRFLSYMAVQRSKLQLVGAACMFIAAKYEEIYPPDVAEFCYITDDTYNKRQVLRMEHLVLKVLGFDLSVPTTFLFINKMCEMDRSLTQDKKARVAALAAYLSELALVDGEKFLRYTPSLMAAACVALARHTLLLDVWPSCLQERTGYKLDELKECLCSLHSCFGQAESSAQQATREKYKASKYYSVSDLSPLMPEHMDVQDVQDVQSPQSPPVAQ